MNKEEQILLEKVLTEEEKNQKRLELISIHKKVLNLTEIIDNKRKSLVSHLLILDDLTKDFRNIQLELATIEIIPEKKVVEEKESVQSLLDHLSDDVKIELRNRLLNIT